MKPTPRAQRFFQIFSALCSDDHATALTLVLPLIDKIGKDVYGIQKVGKRFDHVLTQNNDFLYWFMSGGLYRLEATAEFVFTGNAPGEQRLSELIYNVLRQSLLHDGKMSEKVIICGSLGRNEAGKICIPWTLGWALTFLAASYPCFQKDLPLGIQITYSNHLIPVAELWGDRVKMMKWFEETAFSPRTLPPEKDPSSEKTAVDSPTFSAQFLQIFKAFTGDDYQSGLSLLFPLLDRAGGVIYTLKEGDTQRIKRVVKDNTDFVCWFMSYGRYRNVRDDPTFRNISSPGDVWAEHVYKNFRNFLLHEGALMDGAAIESPGERAVIQPDDPFWTIPRELCWALALMAVTLPCFSDSCPPGSHLIFRGRPIPLEEIWGTKLVSYFDSHVFRAQSPL